MKAAEFVHKVKTQAGIDSVEGALLASRAALETLADRLSGNGPRELAAQLPPEIGQYLHGEQAGRGERLSTDEFIVRVSQREGVDEPTAKHHAQAVFQVLSEAVSAGELDDVRAQLPPEYHTLFVAESQRPTRQ